MNKVVSLVSIPCNLGQPFLGPDLSPQLLKDAGLLSLLSDCGWRVKLLPDILPTPVPSRLDEAAALIAKNAKNCAQIGKLKKYCLMYVCHDRMILCRPDMRSDA
jgi:hypothetical protein